MCYALPAMLRGRCSCAISERLAPSPFALPSLFRLLSPTIPVHQRNAPVSPIIPVLTQKQGGGGIFFRFLISPPQCPPPAPTRSGCPAPVPIRSGWRVVSVPPSLPPRSPLVTHHHLLLFPEVPTGWRVLLRTVNCRL